MVKVKIIFYLSVVTKALPIAFAIEPKLVAMIWARVFAVSILHYNPCRIIYYLNVGVWLIMAPEGSHSLSMHVTFHFASELVLWLYLWCSIVVLHDCGRDLSIISGKPPTGGCGFKYSKHLDILAIPHWLQLWEEIGRHKGYSGKVLCQNWESQGLYNDTYRLTGNAVQRHVLNIKHLKPQPFAKMVEGAQGSSLLISATRWLSFEFWKRRFVYDL